MEEGQQQTIPAILLKLAHLLGTEVTKRKLEIPKKFGKGYCIGYVFNEHIRMLISNYMLYEDLAIENPDIDHTKRMIFFKFQHVFPNETPLPNERSLTELPSVLIATSRINTDEVVSIHSNTAVINIEVDADYLSSLFHLPEKSPLLQNLLQNTEPLLFEQILFPSLQKIVDEIISPPAYETFELFFARIKAEELICRLLMELEKRDEQNIYPINMDDIKTIYQLKAQMLENLASPPLIKLLASEANMSPTKLKRLFKQIFGNSIFSYYQEFRMKEAARLLKEGTLSVSDVGYQLGFTNLGHFSRVFKHHIGMNPKRYSKSIN